MLLYLALASKPDMVIWKGRNMFKVKMRVLLSLFCVMFSCVLTILCLYISNDNKVSNEIIVAKAVKNSKMPEEISVEEVNVVGDENDNKEIEENKEVISKDNTTNDTNSDNEEILKEIEIVEPEKVYDGMTLDELASKLDRSLKNDLSGKGHLYASYSLEKGVDPYLAVAISLEETGCNWNCSTLVKSCNNVGGMKGTGCGSYGYFNTLDDGIKAFIDNISRNYVAYGLTTADLMNPKYAENPAWSTNVNNYISIIRSN